VAALIKQELGLDTTLTEGGRGEFTVWVDGANVARKDTSGFPSDDDVLTAVRGALHG